MRLHSFVLLAACLSVVAQGNAAENAQRVRYDYQMHCQGCHTPDGTGAGHVPGMKNFVGTFLGSQAGREYLVRVPGSATSALGDARLAAVLNWVIDSFAGPSRPDDFRPYTADEVGALRRKPLNEVEAYRARILSGLVASANEET
ncbi:MAG: cytochrome c, class I [Chromatocurvus sp.]